MDKKTLKSNIFFGITFAIIFLSIGLSVFSYLSNTESLLFLKYSYFIMFGIFIFVSVFFRVLGEKLLFYKKKKYTLHSITGILIIIYLNFLFSFKIGYARIYSPVKYEDVVFYDVFNSLLNFMLIIMVVYIIMSFIYFLTSNDFVLFKNKLNSLLGKEKISFREVYSEKEIEKEEKLYEEKDVIYVKIDFIDENNFRIID